MSSVVEWRIEELEKAKNRVLSKTEINELLDVAIFQIKDLFSELNTVKMNQIRQDYSMNWIPCKEKLPEPNHNADIVDCYLVTNGCYIWMAYRGLDHWFYANGTNSGDNVINQRKIIAWMPLPKPYHEGRRE